MGEPDRNKVTEAENRRAGSTVTIATLRRDEAPALLASLSFFFFFNLFMAVLGLRFCARTFSSCGKWGPLLIAVRGPLIIAASLVAEHRLQMRRLSNCGSRAQLLRGMWDLPRPGLEPVSPALAGRLSTTAPPGKPQSAIFILSSFLLSAYFAPDTVLGTGDTMGNKIELII